MTDHITLTAAELGFLTSTLDPDGTSTALSIMGVGDDDLGAPAVRAGFGSLVARGLLVAEGDSMQLAPALAAVGEGMLRARLCVEVGLVAKDRIDGTVLFDTGQLRILVSPRAFRCFDVTGLESSVDVVDPLVRIAERFLSEHKPGVASMRILSPSRRAGSRAGAGEAWATLGAGEDGGWAFATGPDPDLATSGLPVTEAIEAFRQALTAATRSVLSAA